ncbi:influenza virus NS1A-binding protein homolog isoform X2 [Onthophagus taurus]|uniref:influenza virus NS1A-binding protein homolog isoform X2 n=1 Tax=Onthophagus taurus TaxID=166361 RepID=UPI000C20B6AA|nr:influenza virus NS1A-binding protein homolog isoform X1 [Onthophagus taurus]
MVKSPITNGIPISTGMSSSMEFLKQTEGDLFFNDEALQEDNLSALNMMRKNRHFCDVILHIGTVEIHAHRAILASVSPYLFELFSTDHEKRIENIVTYKLNGGFDKSAFQILVDYAYTGHLQVPTNQVKAVYIASCHLKIDRVARKCAQYLINHLSVENCIEIRSLPGIAKNKEFIHQVDNFIANNFDQINQSSYLINLYCARIEVLNQTKEEMSLVNSSSLCRLVLEWIRRQITEDNLSLATLSENTFMLYLAIDNSLQDCNSLPNGDVCNTEIVQDYKKLSSKNVGSANKIKRKQLSQPSKPRVLIYSREIGEELESEMEPHWTLIATSKVAEHSYVALVTLAGKLAKLSIQLRLNIPTTPSPVATPEANKNSNEDKPDLYYTLANMSCPRCGVGCGNLNNTLIVCGGYDRVECLRTVEQYIPETNKWVSLPSMRQGRGRFQIAILSSKVYAIGGSNGLSELDTVEMLDLDAKKWVNLPKLSLARSFIGVSSLDGQIYCVGGWNGQVGTKQCDVFNPKTEKWSNVAPLNVGRYQAGVTALNGLLYVIGGCDSWNCLSSVEVYDPKGDVWTVSKPLITARRGCGVAVFNNKIYVVGGSDGTHVLNTTEVFDVESKMWEVGPTLTVPRVNVEIAVVGDRLYAVGGFSGKSFLNTIEYLDPITDEWTTFIPRKLEDGEIKMERNGLYEDKMGPAVIDCID